MAGGAGTLTSVLAAYVAFRVIPAMYFRGGDPDASRQYWTNFVAIFCALCVAGAQLYAGSII